MKTELDTKTDQDKFSVLMSVYIKEDPIFFDEALTSNLIEQTRLPDEMVLICDGPLTDELNAVIAKYEAQFPNILKVYRLAKNGGLGNALNYGLEKCSYEWIARADSDDICDKDRFKMQMDYVKTHLDVDVVSSFIDEFEECPDQPVQKKVLPLTHEDIVQFAKFRNPISHAAVLFKKSVILRSGSYQHLAYVEDYYLWVRAIHNGARMANIDKCLVHVRIGNGMVQRRSNREYIKSWKILNTYMKDNHMINSTTYFKNMLAIRAFIYMPVGLKSYIYKTILRK